MYYTSLFCFACDPWIAIEEVRGGNGIREVTRALSSQTVIYLFSCLIFLSFDNINR